MQKLNQNSDDIPVHASLKTLIDYKSTFGTDLAEILEEYRNITRVKDLRGMPSRLAKDSKERTGSAIRETIIENICMALEHYDEDPSNREIRVIYIKFDDLLIEQKLKKKAWNHILNADLVIVDDMFYMTPTQEELEQAYRIMMFLQETRSLVLITNRALSSWKEMKVDSHLVETLQKRLMQGAQLISLA